MSCSKLILVISVTIGLPVIDVVTLTNAPSGVSEILNVVGVIDLT